MLVRSGLSVFLVALVAVQPAVLLALPSCCPTMPAGDQSTAAACPMHHGTGEECPHATALHHDSAVDDESAHATAPGTEGCALVCGGSHDAVAMHQTPRGLLPAIGTGLSRGRLVSAFPIADAPVLTFWFPPLSPPPRG